MDVVQEMFDFQCRERTKKIEKSLPRLSAVDFSTYKTGDHLKIIQHAMPLLKTAADQNRALELLEALHRAISGGAEDHVKFRLLNSVALADPALFFPSCRKPMDKVEAKALLPRLQRELNRRIPKREAAVSAVCKYAIRRMIGDTAARSPLLIGPPGGGKSVLVREFSRALTTVGVGAEVVFQPMTQDTGRVGENDAGMRLNGTSMHYSNGAPGSLYDAVCKPEVRVGIVHLDEADKTMQKDYLVGLLDPALPLEDNYIREVIKGVDLRCKSLILLTANDAKRLNRGPDDPLWSRLDPVVLEEYSEKEKIAVAVALLTKQQDSLYAADARRVRKLAKEAIASLGKQASFRAIIDRIQERLFDEEFGLQHSKETPDLMPGQHRPVGFNR